MPDIFISYASTDRERAGLLADALTKRGYSVWWDRTIPPGRVFDEVIQEAIQGAKCMIVLWSADSVRSNWVKTEASEGATRGILVPAVIGEVNLPIEFKRIQSANLAQWEGGEEDGEYLNLLESVESLMKQDPKSSNAGPSPMKSYRPTSAAARPYWETIKIFGMGTIVAVAAVVAFLLFGKMKGTRDVSTTAATAPEPAKASANSAPVPASSSTARTSSPARGRVNLLSEEQGGQLLVASKDDWKKLIDGKEETYVYVDNGFGVFGFRDGKSVLVDTFAVLVPDQSDTNLKDFELFVGNASPTGPFESMGRFSTQNMRMMQNPYQEFRFPPAKAKYFKLQSLRNHVGSSGAVSAYEIQLFGELP